MTECRSQQIFVDTSRLGAIDFWCRKTGVARGVTLNQLIMKNDGVTDLDKHIRKMCKLVAPMPVSVELLDSKSSTKDLMVEARRLVDLGQGNVVVKVPIVERAGRYIYPKTVSRRMLEVIAGLVDEGIPVNVTAMTTDMQMKLATAITQRSSGISFVSLFWGRSIMDHKNYRNASEGLGVKDRESMGEESVVNRTPGEIVGSVLRFIGGLPQPRIIVGSIRNPGQVENAFSAGADIVTVTPGVLRLGLYSRRTLETVAEFDKAGSNLR